MAQHEFLPLCDVLFNIISLASYFCDVVFDLVMGYALFERGRILWFAVSISLVASSLLVSQFLSMKWYLRSQQARRDTKEKQQKENAKEATVAPNHKQCLQWAVAVLHLTQCGVLWRYFKLFIPVDLRYVKHEVRDLCMLRLFHAFCEAAPMLLLQLYLLWQETSPKEFSDLNMVSTILSLFSVCWALASFSKNVRLQNVHRLVLTWLGVIFQFLWRLGTVSSRVTALTVYATLYGHWVFLVIGLHWFSMFLWLISPKNVFHGERISRQRKAAFSALIAIVYIFSYINLQEVNPRQKMVTFYVVMFLENSLLVIAWLVAVWDQAPWYRDTVPLVVFLSFAVGIAFMAIYYRFFHVRRLHYEAGGRPSVYGNNCDSTQRLSNHEATIGDGVIIACKEDVVKVESNGKVSDAHLIANGYHRYTNANGFAPLPYHNGIPGVFNCRFNNPAAATKRKKKKPTTFVPPPSVGVSVATAVAASISNPLSTNTAAGSLEENPSIVPFWRRPLPNHHNHQGGSSENEASSVGSRVNIQQKLHEKKQKQLAELRVIEEEIKQGKLARPTCAVGGGGPGGGGSGAPSGLEEFGSLPRQPIPRAKRHDAADCWPPPSPPASRPLPPPYSYHIIPPPRAKHRANTPEILLAPHYLESAERLYYGWEPHYGDCASDQGSSVPEDRATSDVEGGGGSTGGGPGGGDSVGNGEVVNGSGADAQLMYKSYRIPSDMDSQISLPRSYTLPREFKYYRRPKSRKAVRSQHFVASNNSSDGDVDSGDEPTPKPTQAPRPLKLRAYRGHGPRRDHHETKL